MQTASLKNLLVIASFPEKGEIHGAKVVGGATYTKNTLLALLKSFPQLSITVLAEKFSPQKNSYLDKEIHVARVWQRNSFLSFFTLFWEILSHHQKTKKILIEFELSMFGGIPYLLPFPFFLSALRLFGKEVHMVLHQVVLDVNDIHGHINVKPHSVKAKLYSILISTLYTILVLLSTNVIVFEKIFADRLSSIAGKKRLTIIPHGVEHFEKAITQKDAKTQLSLPTDTFVLVVFGFLAWYKGSDWIVSAFKKLQEKDSGKKFHLVLAGGPNPNHLEKDFYVSYIKSLEKADNGSTIHVTGFVPEEKIALYYEASDLVVLPYRTLMSSSGPLSLAYSFNKPFLLSNTLKDILGTQDVDKTLSELSLKKSDFLFTTEDDFIEKVTILAQDQAQLKKMTTFTHHIAERRSWKSIAQEYYETLFT